MLNKVFSTAKLAPRYLNKYHCCAFSTLKKPFSEKDTALQFSIFDGTDFGTAKGILKQDFTSRQEPVCYHLSTRNFDFFLDPYLTKAAEDQTSIIVTVNDVFAGIALNNDFTFKENQRFVDELKKKDYFGFDLIFQIERALNHDFRHEMYEKELFEKGNILRMVLFGIDPHYANQGLGSILTEKVVELAREKRYKYVTCAATNHFMKNSASKSGFECLSTLKYDEWEYPKGSNVFPKAGMAEITGFDEMSFMVYRLPSTAK